MIVFVCSECGHSIRTVGQEAEDLLGRSSKWWPNKYPCPLCGSDASSSLNASGVVIDLTPQEAFAAFNGLGLPLERECGELAVKHAFESSEVAKVHTKVVNRRRCCVEAIELKDGTKLFFGSSAYGAVVYRISRPHSYTTAVLQEIAEQAEKQDA